MHGSFLASEVSLRQNVVIKRKQEKKNPANAANTHLFRIVILANSIPRALLLPEREKRKQKGTIVFLMR